MKSQFDIIIHRIWERRVAFFSIFFFVVLITYAVLVIIDFIPEAKDEVDSQINENTLSAVENGIEPPLEIEEPVTEIVAPTGSRALPIKMIFDDLNNKEVMVLNPTSSDIAALDSALLSGVVHHPESADFSEKGNIFILGHSSYLPNVLNKNFQAFNGIQKLSWGDTIRVQSEDMEYTYRVQEVYEAAASEIFVPETPGEAKLTLATCNVLGAKEDRFVVEATLFDTKPL